MNYVDFYRDCISDPNHSTQLASTMAPTTKGDIVMKFEKNGRSRIILKNCSKSFERHACPPPPAR